MFPCNEEDIPEARFGKVPGFFHYLLNGEGRSQYRIIPREATVRTIINAFVRQIDGCEKPHCVPKMLARDRDRLLCEPFKAGILGGVDDSPKALEGR